MREKELANFSIKQKAVFDEDKLYGIAPGWAEDLNIDLAETDHKAKGGLSVTWGGEKKHSHYVKSEYEVKLSINDAAPVEIIKEGKKVKKTKANVKIKITASIITDYDEKWEDTDFKKKFEKFYDTFIYGSHIKKHKTDIAKWTQQLFDLYKKELEGEE